MTYVVRAYYYAGKHCDVAVFRFKDHAVGFLENLKANEKNRLVWYAIRERVNFKLTIGPTKSL